MRQGVIADAISPCELLQKLEIPEFDDKPALVGIEKPVDFRLTVWLLKGNAQKDFERGGRETKTPDRAVLLAQICGQRCCTETLSADRRA